MSSRQIVYEFTAKQSLTAAFQQTQQSVAGAAGSMGEFSQRISATATESDKLKVSVRETGNEFTRMKDAATAAAAQNKAGFEAQRNELRLVAEQARTTAAQVRAEQAKSGGQSGGGIGLPQIAGGAFLGNLASQGVQALAGGITNAAESSLTLAGNLEQSQVAFTGLLGSASKATDLIGQLRDLDLQAGIFNFQDLQKYSTALLGVGDSAQRIIPDLKDLGSEIAGRGQGPQQLEQATLAYEQVIAKGHLAGQEALQFQNAQIPIWQILAEALHKNVGEIQKMSEAGAITSQIVQDAFHLDAVTKFGTALADQTHTFNGLVDTGKDLGQIFLATFGEGVIKDLEPRLQGAMDALQNPAVLASIKAWGVEAGKFVGQLFDAAKVVASWAGLQLPDIPAAPSFAPAKEDTAALQANLQRSVASSSDFTRQITAAKTEVQQLRDGQAASSAASQQAANDIRDAQTGVDRSYDRQLNSLKDAGTQMERNYQVAKQQRDLEQARQSLSDDTRLAGDIFSSAGQAARERLKDDRKRVTDTQEQIAQDTAKFENRTAQTSVERAKQASDQRAQDAITGLQRAQQAEEQANAARIRDLEATARNYEALQKALANPDKAIKQASDAYQRFYSVTIPQQAEQGAHTALGVQVAPYQTFFQTTLPKLAEDGRPLIVRALFGDSKTQAQAGTELATNTLQGVSAGITAWSKGKGSPMMNLLMGGDSLADAFKNWSGGAAGIENAGIGAAGALRQAAGIDAPGAGGVGKGPQSNATRAAADPGNYTANPFDPSSYNPLDAIGKAVGRISAQVAGGAYTDNALSATRPPDAMPLISGQSAAAQAAALTAQWRAKGFKGQYVFERGHLVWQPDAPTGGARASGGPVEPGGVYTVGEQGPETLFMGSQGGYVAPRGSRGSSGGDTYIFNISGAIGNPSQLADYLQEVLAKNMRARGAR